MRRSTVFGLAFWVVSVAAVAFVMAQQEVPPPTVGDAPPRAPAREQTKGTAATAGSGNPKEAAGASAPLTALVMKNGRVIQGSVRRAERGYYVDMPQSSIFLPFEHVKFAATDLHDAYLQLSKSIADLGPERDLLLGRWSLENGLYSEAIGHFRAVLRLDAANQEARVSLAKLETLFPSDSSSSPAARANPSGESAPLPESLSRLSGESVAEFVTGIQPLLISRCGSVKCHGGRAAGGFHLEHVRLGRASNRAATARNLDAVLREISPLGFRQSALLRKGSQPHGGPPRSQWNGPAVAEQQARLRSWTGTVAGELKRLQRDDAARADLKSAPEPGQPASIRDPKVLPAGAADAERPLPPPVAAPSRGRPAETKSAADEKREGEKPGGPLTDPFDPAEFNSPQQHQR